MSASDIANIYASINNLQNQFDAITGNTLSNYNQLSRIVSQQGNIYNSVYYGSGNIVTGNLIVGGNATISSNLNVDNGTLYVDNVNNRVGILNTNPQYDLDVKGSANISSTLITLYTKPNYDSGWFAVAANTSYPLNLGFTINLATPPTFKVLFSSTSTGIIGDGTGTANIVVDVTSQGLNTNFDQSYGIRYSSNSSIILRTGDFSIILYYNGNTQLYSTSGYYRVYAY